MTLIETEILIAAPPTTVWAVLTDFAAYTDWNPYLVRIEGEARVGAVLMVTQLPRPGMDTITAPVDLAAIQGHEMLWIGGLPDRSRFCGHHVLRVESADGGSRFVHNETFEGSDVDAMLARYEPLIRTNFAIFNVALKARVEALYLSQ